MEIIRFIQQMTNEFLDGFFIFFTLFGEETAVVVSIAVVYWCVSKPFAFKMTMVYLFSALINFGIKNIVKEPRPTGVRKLFGGSATSYSFPSGHAQSVALYTSCITRKYLKKNLFAVLGGVLLILLVMFSRMYLGHHYLIDVAVGAALGYAVGWFGSMLMDKVRINSLWYLLLGLPAVLLLIFVSSRTVYKAVGGGISLIAGYILEERYVKSGNPRNAKAVVMRLLVGLGVAAAIYLGLSAIPVSDKFLDLGVFFVLGMWVSCIAPMVFCRIEKLSLFNGKRPESGGGETI